MLPKKNLKNKPPILLKPKKNRKKRDGSPKHFDTYGENIKSEICVMRVKERKLVSEEYFRVYEIKENWLTG